MDKDKLAIVVSYAINWNEILFHLNMNLGIDINNDSEVFSEIESNVADMLFEAIEENEEFILKNY
jgi:hypothetical protein